MSQGSGPDADDTDELTLRDLLDVPDLGLGLVTAPGDADTPIRWVHPTELLDPRPYLRGGELVLTVGSALTTEEACRDFVAHLREAGVAAVGFGVGDVQDEVPAALVAACRHHDLPLVEVSPGVPFQAIGELLAEHRTQVRIDRAARRDRRRELGRLVELVLRGRADAEALRTPIREAGLDPDLPVVPAAWPADVAPLVAAELGPALVAELEGSTVTLSSDAGRVRDVAEELSVPCGLGDGAVLHQLPEVLPPALVGLGVARRRGGVVTSRDLTSFEALLELQPPERIAPFTEQLIAPLISHDRGSDGALLQTLRTFLDNDGSVGGTARDLYLHPNSLRHRLRRIEELTGADPRAFRDRVGLAIGLWAWDRDQRRRR